LVERLDLSEERLAHWKDSIIAHLYIPYDPESGLFEQYEGFFALEDLNWAGYEPRTTSIQALLGIEDTQRYQVLKQPDVLMLLYLLESEYSWDVIRANWDYYTPRTDLSYGSSLGPAIQAALAARLGDAEVAYQHFIHATRTDLRDVRGNAGDGIHAATAGGIWQAVVFGFGGVRLSSEGLTTDPHLPPHWTRLKFRLYHQGECYTFDLRPAYCDPTP